MRISALFLSLVAVLDTAGSVAQAQVVRTWVSGTGIDNAACDRSNPCRTFGSAILAVGTGGEVVVLDSAGYGPVTIDKAVSIISPPGIFAAIAPTAGSAISIAAGVTDSRIVLRGLTLNGRGANFGIAYGGASDNSGNRLYIEDCWVGAFGNTGINLIRSGAFFIRNTVVRENFVGIRFAALPDVSTAVLHGVRLERSTLGMILNSGKATFRDSTVSGSLGGAIHVGTVAATIGATPILKVERSQITHNDAGIFVFSGGSLRLFDSDITFTALSGITVSLGTEAVLGGNTITDNETGIYNEGTILTKGDNSVERNETDLAGPSALTAYTPR